MKSTFRYFVVVAIASFVIGLPWVNAQGAGPKYEVVATPICWKTGGTDSNLIRYSLISPSSGQPSSLFYINSLGAVINPTGGILKMGWCCNCGGGGGGDTVTIAASNGLTLAAGNDVELGGILDRLTEIQKNGNTFRIGATNFAVPNVGYMYVEGSTNNQGFYTKSASNETDVSVIPGLFAVESNTLPATSTNSHINVAPGLVSMDATNGLSLKLFKIDQNFVLTGLPVYANDAAADADVTLVAGGLYKITGDRLIRVKP